MRYNQLFLVVFLLLMQGSSVLNCLAQTHFFNNYQVDNGLSNNSVLSILQDKSGFMWFGTKDGLNRFDGHSFKVIRLGYQLTRPIKSSFVQSLKEDKNGIIWIGSENGLYNYDPVSEKLRLVPGTEGDDIGRLNFSSDGKLWFLSSLSLRMFDPKKKKIKVFEQLKSSRITDICVKKNGEIWVIADDFKIWNYNVNLGSFNSFKLFEGTRSPYISSLRLLEIDNQRILVSGSRPELKIFDITNKNFQTIPIPTGGSQKLFLRALLKVSDDEYWIGGESGVFIYHQQTRKFNNLRKRYDDTYSLSDNAVHSLYKDREGGIWVGTYFGGVNYLSRQHNLFQKFTPRIAGNALSGNVVKQLEEDHFGNVWIGTEDGGLDRFNPKTGQFKNFSATGTSAAISHNNIQGLLAANDQLWIGVFQSGINVMDIKSGKIIRRYKLGKTSGLKSDFVYCFYRTAKGEILVGTTMGLCRYSKMKDAFEPVEGFLENFYCSSILEDSKGVLYATSFGKGIFYYNPRSKSNGNIRNVEGDSASLINNWVTTSYEDSRHNLWFGTRTGLCKLDRLTGKIASYAKINSFLSNYISAIEEDKFGYLWISTAKGLVRFDTGSKLTEVFTRSEGLLSDQFNVSSSLRTSDGTLYFGSLKGLNAFRPGDFKKRPSVPRIFLTSFEVNNEVVSPQDFHGILEKSITHTQDVKLNFNQSSFNIEFTALNFSSPQSLTYAFKLEGLAKSWTFIDRNRKVYFTQVPAGRYVFKVKSKNILGHWGPEQAVLSIQITPPWWKSFVAYCLYGLLLLLLSALAFYFYHQSIDRKNQRKLDMLSVAKEKEMFASKMDFFINVAHEIRTPLTLIRAPMPKLIKAAEQMPEIAKSVETINRNSERLIELSNQLLDLRSTELSKFRLKLKKIRLSEILVACCEGFTNLAEQAGVTFDVKLPVKPLYCYSDEDSINKVLFNLLSNAVKYAEERVYVELMEPEGGSSSYKIIVRNDGILIPEDLRSKVFEPFFRLKHHEKINGTGIGLALVLSLIQLLEGELIYTTDKELNTFIVTLPCNPIDKEKVD